MNGFVGELFAAGSSKTWSLLVLLEGIDPCTKGENARV